MLHLKWLTAQISENQVYVKYIFWRHIMEFDPLYLWIISVKVHFELRDLSCHCGKKIKSTPLCEPLLVAELLYYHPVSPSQIP